MAFLLPIQYQVDGTVTHLIVGTDQDLFVPRRTPIYLQALVSRSVIVVSHLWIEACTADIFNFGKSEDFLARDKLFPGMETYEGPGTGTGGVEASFMPTRMKGWPPLLHNTWGSPGFPKSPLQVCVSEEETFQGISR